MHVLNNGTIRNRIYTKDTHPDQNLNLESTNPLEYKTGVVTVVIDRYEYWKELDHIKNALKVNRYIQIGY